MPPLQRAKFLEAAIPPVIEATKRLAANAVSADPGQARGNDSPAERSSNDEEQDSSSSCEGNHARGMDVQQPPAAEDNPPRAVYEAAASAAETAVEFVGPLLEQACMEGALARGSAAAASAAAADPEKKSGERERNAYPGPGNAYASDLAVAAYTGFALSALEISVETSASATALAPAATAIAAVSPAEALERDNSVFVMKLAAAEERLVGLVMSSPTVDLPLILLHVYRLSFHDRVRARGKGGGDEQSEVSAPGSGCGGLAGLAELAVAGSSPWTLQGVSSLAYLVRFNLFRMVVPMFWGTNFLEIALNKLCSSHWVTWMTSILSLFGSLATEGGGGGAGGRRIGFVGAVNSRRLKGKVSQSSCELAQGWGPPVVYPAACRIHSYFCSMHRLYATLPVTLRADAELLYSKYSLTRCALSHCGRPRDIVDVDIPFGRSRASRG